MSYSYSEAKAAIAKIKASTSDYESSIRSVQSEIVNKMNDLTTISNSISSEIVQSDIVAFSNADIGNLYNSMGSALGTGSSALSTLSKDATDEIARIVADYNSGIQYDEETGRPKTPFLTPEEISLSGIPEAAAFVGGSDGGNSGKKGGGTRSNNSNPTNTTPTNNSPTTPTNTNPTMPTTNMPTSFNDYLLRLSSGDIYSSNINGWNSYVSDFLNTYNLSDSVSSITIEGQIVKCKLKNGKEIVLRNISSESALASAIKSNL